MESSQPNYNRINSGLSTTPSLSISTSTSASCASSVLSTSLGGVSDSPYYYYTSPASASSSPINTHSPFRQSYRSLEKRSHSASVRLRRRTSIPLLPPQRSASAGSSLLKDSSSSALYQHNHQHQQQRLTSSFIENNISDHDTGVRYRIMDDGDNKVSTSFDPITPIDQQASPQRWDDSQLAMELADDLPSSPTLSTRENIKSKVRQWITPNMKQQRRPIHKWFSDRTA